METGSIGIGNTGIGNIFTMATFSNCAVAKMDAMFVSSIMQRIQQD